jgi:hypothetical protein
MPFMSPGGPFSTATPGGAPSLEDKLPTHSYELIRLLDKAFPPRCVSARTRNTEALMEEHRYAGLRELIEELVQAMNQEVADVTEQVHNDAESPPGG